MVEWAPVALYHAVMKHGAAIYIEPWGKPNCVHTSLALQARSISKSRTIKMKG